MQDTGLGANALLVAFSGLSFRADGQIPFEFLNLFSDIDVDKAFVRDLDQCFYQRGIQGLGRSIPEAAEQLAQFASGYERIVFVGVSAGGYAALLLGAMLRVSHVAAMSPQTFLGRRQRYLRDERRFEKKVRAAQEHAVSPKHLDVKPTMRRSGGVTRFTVYYPARHVLDSRHARRLANVRGVDLEPVDSDEHTFVRGMRSDGSLKDLVIGLLHRQT